MPDTKAFLMPRAMTLISCWVSKAIFPPLRDVGEHVNCRPLLTKTILGVAKKLMLTKVAADVVTDETLHNLRYYR